MCFVGQFLRSTELNSDIRRILGNTSFDAFVASSTQHEELDKNSVVDEAEVCSGLSRRGFENCYADLVPYDSRVYARMTDGIEFQRCLRTLRKTMKRIRESATLIS